MKILYLALLITMTSTAPASVEEVEPPHKKAKSAEKLVWEYSRNSFTEINKALRKLEDKATPIHYLTAIHVALAGAEHALTDKNKLCKLLSALNWAEHMLKNGQLPAKKQALAIIIPLLHRLIPLKASCQEKLDLYTTDNCLSDEELLAKYVRDTVQPASRDIKPVEPINEDKLLELKSAADELNDIENSLYTSNKLPEANILKKAHDASSLLTKGLNDPVGRKIYNTRALLYECLLNKNKNFKSAAHETFNVCQVLDRDTRGYMIKLLLLELEQDNPIFIDDLDTLEIYYSAYWMWSHIVYEPEHKRTALITAAALIRERYKSSLKSMQHHFNLWLPKDFVEVAEQLLPLYCKDLQQQEKTDLCQLIFSMLEFQYFNRARTTVEICDRIIFVCEQLIAMLDIPKIIESFAKIKNEMINRKAPANVKNFVAPPNDGPTWIGLRDCVKNMESMLETLRNRASVQDYLAAIYAHRAAAGYAIDDSIEARRKKDFDHLMAAAKYAELMFNKGNKDPFANLLADICKDIVALNPGKETIKKVEKWQGICAQHMLQVDNLPAAEPQPKKVKVKIVLRDEGWGDDDIPPMPDLSDKLDW